MLKKLSLILIFLLFAKPAYDLFTSLLVEESVIVEDVSQSIEAPNVVMDEVQSVTSQPQPGTVTSVNQLADTFSYYFDRLATEFTIEYKGNTANLEKILEQAVQLAIQEDTYIGGHLSMREIQYEYTKTAATIQVQQSYLTTIEQEHIVDAMVDQLLENVDLTAISDYEKVKFVNDHIVKNTMYSDQAIASPHSAYAVAYEGRGVCQGYALFAQKLLTAMGMESIYMTGDVYTGGHAWNLVKVDSQWYHLDTTWNDPLPDRGNGVRYQYFLVNDQDMRKDHTWEAQDYPKAASAAYRYMHTMQDSYVKDGFIYFSHTGDDNKLYRFNQATGKAERLGDVRALYIVGEGEWLYFSNYSKGAYLSKIKIDGTALDTIYREEVRSLFIEDGYIYFAVSDGKKKIALH